MAIKTRTPRVDKRFVDFSEEIARQMRAKTGRPVSFRRVTAAIPRVPGLREALLRANWVEENKRRRKG